MNERATDVQSADLMRLLHQHAAVATSALGERSRAAFRSDAALQAKVICSVREFLDIRRRLMAWYGPSQSSRQRNAFPEIGTTVLVDGQPPNLKTIYDFVRRVLPAELQRLDGFLQLRERLRVQGVLDARVMTNGPDG